jgi:cytochrome c oxidase subunit 2
MVVLMRAAVRILFILLLVAGGSLGGFARLATQPAALPEQIVDVTAERFSFTPSEIRTAVGTTLVIRVSSEDTDHGFYIIGTDVNIEIPKRGRGTATVRFTPDRTGRYTFECSQICGAGHSFMRGEIVVQDPSEATR